MATIVSEFPTTRTRVTKYPYRDWFDGQAWELTQGEDFDVAVASFRGAISAAATRNGVKVRTAVTEDGNGVVIQVIPTKGHVEKTVTKPTPVVVSEPKPAAKPAAKKTPAKKTPAKKTDKPTAVTTVFTAPVAPSEEQTKAAKELAK